MAADAASRPATLSTDQITRRPITMRDSPTLRGPDIPPFYAGQIGAQAQRLRRAGRSVIGMHFGQPTEPPPPGVHAAAHRAIDGGPTGYYESPELRERIARHYLEAYGLRVPLSLPP